MPGYKKKGTCMTHTSREMKNAATFIFQAHHEGLPEFSGYLVYSYTSHARLVSKTERYRDITQRANDTEQRRRWEARLGITTEKPDNDDCAYPRKRAGIGHALFGTKDNCIGGLF